MVAATQPSIKDLRERAEGPFSGNPPSFFTSTLSLWMHSDLLGHYKIGPPWMEGLESGRERDPGMKEPCRNPLQAPPRLAVSPTYRDKKPPRPQTTESRHPAHWLRTRLENVRKSQIPEVCIKKEKKKTLHFNALHFHKHHYNKVLMLDKDPIAPLTPPDPGKPGEKGQKLLHKCQFYWH